MSIALTGTLTATTTADHPLDLPRLCVQTWVPGSTISADSDTDATPAIAVRSPLTYSYWQAETMPAVLTVDFGQARQVDYAAVYVRMPEDSSTQFMVETFDGLTWTQQGDSTSIVRDGSIVWLFDKHSAEQIRLTVTGDAPMVATFQAGLATVIPMGFQSGFSPASLNPQDEYTNTVSEGGQVLGRSVVRSGMEQAISIQPIKPEWVRDEWPGLRRLLRNRGAWLVWNAKDYPREIVYGMSSGNPSTSYSHTNYMSINLNLEGPAA